MMHSIDSKGAIQSVSSAWLDVLGYEWAEVVGRKSTEFLTEESRIKAQGILTEFFENGFVQGVEYQFVKKDGTIVDISLSATSFQDEESGETFSFATLTDITNQKWMQERDRLLIEGSMVGIWEWPDVNKSEAIWSPKFYELLGYTADEMKPGVESFQEIMHSDDIEGANKILKRHFENNEPFDVEYRLKTKNSGYRWFRGSGQVARDKDGAPTRMVGSLSDIHEQKMSSIKIEENNDFLDSIIENIPNMIFLKHASDLTFCQLNKAGEDLLGLSREKFIGKNDFDFFPKEQAEFFVNADRDVLKSKVGVTIDEEPIETISGTRYLRTKKIPLMDKNGNPEFLLGISEDITDIKKMTETLANSSKLAAMGELAGGMAHEINNPLMVLAASLDIVETLLSKDDFDKQKILQYVGKCNKTINRMAKIIDGLRHVARDGQSEPSQAVTIKSLVLPSMDIISNRLEKFNIDFKIDETSLEKEIDCYPTQLSQVIFNLISNAIDAVSDNPDPWVELEVSENTDHHLIVVENSGAPISPEVCQKIFDPFFSTKTVGRGMGLGLSISKGIAERHGGRIYLDNQCSHPRFVVEIPKSLSDSGEMAS